LKEEGIIPLLVEPSFDAVQLLPDLPGEAGRCPFGGHDPSLLKLPHGVLAQDADRPRDGA